MNWKMLLSYNLYVFVILFGRLVWEIQNHSKLDDEKFLLGIGVIIAIVLFARDLIDDRLLEIKELIKSKNKEN